VWIWVQEVVLVNLGTVASSSSGVFSVSLEQRTTQQSVISRFLFFVLERGDDCGKVEVAEIRSEDALIVGHLLMRHGSDVCVMGVELEKTEKSTRTCFAYS
jgi:hypothetical protein